MAYAKPLRPVIVLSADKAEKFLAKVPDPLERKKEKELMLLFKKNNLRK